MYVCLHRILAAKIAELDHRIQCLSGIEATTGTTSSCISEYSPTQLLLQGYNASSVDSSDILETDTVTRTTANPKCSVILKLNGSENLTTENEESKTSHLGISEDSVDSLSTESGRSILSSEYCGFAEALDTSSLIEFSEAAIDAYKIPSSTTDSGDNSRTKYNAKSQSPHIDSDIARKRYNDLKDLPPELTAMVQQALHELDMRDFDEIVNTDASDYENADNGKVFPNIVTSYEVGESEEKSQTEV